MGPFSPHSQVSTQCRGFPAVTSCSTERPWIPPVQLRGLGFPVLPAGIRELCSVRRCLLDHSEVSTQCRGFPAVTSCSTERPWIPPVQLRGLGFPVLPAGIWELCSVRRCLLDHSEVLGIQRDYGGAEEALPGTHLCGRAPRIHQIWSGGSGAQRWMWEGKGNSCGNGGLGHGQISLSSQSDENSIDGCPP
ncbi:hypothetical protein DV515_00019397 [Chloebia gouldiae]|uniref:Uncharacterized protein n=1 Tax=Chloebia gouldiae TaxID=44316 RepID=A0A3L8Q595_CHLGU|nr:hypothetical protein DV515_00019397 [Chloebia gouldiae]